jgi:hypothetical protein
MHVQKDCYEIVKETTYQMRDKSQRYIVYKVYCFQILKRRDFLQCHQIEKYQGHECNNISFQIEKQARCP